MASLRRKVALKLPHWWAPRNWPSAATQRTRDPRVARASEHRAPLRRRHHDDGRPYLALEYVEGEAHRRLLPRAQARRADARSRCSCRCARGRVRACAPDRASRPQALQHAGRLPGQRASARLRHRQADRATAAPADKALTQVGVRALTPEYASPEQIKGEPIAHRERRRIRSASLLYELLAGARPTHSRATLTARSGRARRVDVRAPSTSRSESVTRPQAARRSRHDRPQGAEEGARRALCERRCIRGRSRSLPARRAGGRAAGSAGYRLRKFATSIGSPSVRPLRSCSRSQRASRSRRGSCASHAPRKSAPRK